MLVSGNTHAKYFKDASLNGQTIRGYVNMGSSAVAWREEDTKHMDMTYL